VTVFGNRVLIEAIKLKWSCEGDPNPNDCCHYLRGNLHRHAQRWWCGDNYVTVEVDRTDMTASQGMCEATRN
jgi:hypothetical protein